jgi:chromosome segregation ATPase
MSENSNGSTLVIGGVGRPEGKIPQMSPLLGMRLDEMNKRIDDEIQSRKDWQSAAENLMTSLSSRLFKLEKDSNQLTQRVCDLEDSPEAIVRRRDLEITLKQKNERITVLEAQVTTLYKIIDDLIGCIHHAQNMLDNSNRNADVYPTHQGCQL